MTAGTSPTKESLSLSPNMKYLVGISRYDVQIWDFEKKGFHSTFFLQTESSYCMAFSPNSQSLAIGFLNGLIKIYPVDGIYKKFKILEGHNNSVNSLDYTRDGNNIISCSNNKSIHIWCIQ